jgi:phosphate transport system ATP-binding protein
MSAGRPVYEVTGLNVYYDGDRAVADVELEIEPNRITAMIGPAGCGKTSVLRSLNRMNDLIPAATVTGKVLFNGEDVYADGVDPLELRRRAGMIFPKPNPFPTSIFENIAFGPRSHEMSDVEPRVERGLREAALWEEVKDRLDSSALGLSKAQQQRMCIARALAVDPDVLLMDEPCSALDPESSGEIEDLMLTLKQDHAIVVVTHNREQAARVSDMTACFGFDPAAGGGRIGRVVEYDETNAVFTHPSDKRTEAYVTGKLG